MSLLLWASMHMAVVPCIAVRPLTPLCVALRYDTADVGHDIALQPLLAGLCCLRRRALCHMIVASIPSIISQCVSIYMGLVSAESLQYIL